MQKSLNRVFLIGHLGGDAEIRTTGNGTEVAGFSIATSRRVKSGDEWKDATEWSRVVMWKPGRLAEYLTKGRAVHVEGRLQTRSYEDRNGEKRYVTEVIAEDVILLGGPKESGTAARAAGQAEESGGSEFPDDDVPF